MVAVLSAWLPWAAFAAEETSLRTSIRRLGPTLETANRDEVFVGRIRKDPFLPRTLHLWVVADNLRKGAATNAVQIVEELSGA